MSEFTVRPARTADVRGIHRMLEPYVQRRILLGKDLVVLYEAVQQFQVAEFLDLAHVKPNTLGNTRMLKTL